MFDNPSVGEAMGNRHSHTVDKSVNQSNQLEERKTVISKIEK